jgi:urea transport system permease protein
MSTPHIYNRATACQRPAADPGVELFMMALIAVCAIAPVLNLWVPEALTHMSTYAVALLGKIMCYAIAALAMDLIWGYTLSLGHGVFFCLWAT